MIKVCIFDLDGTLTDTLDSLTYSVRAALKEMGLPEITQEQCQAFVGNGAKKLLEKSLKAVGDSELQHIDEAMEVYGRIFDCHCTYHVKPYEGIISLLKVLKEKGIKVAVLSNKPHRQTIKVVREILGEDLIDWAQGQQENVARKPDPAAVFSILDHFDAKPSECVYIGDSEVDALTGKNANVKTVCVDWGFRTRNQLIEAGAENLISKAGELLKYL